jgi:hypothetical protein
MHTVTRKTFTLAVATAFAGVALAAPLTGTASAKSYKVSFLLKGKLTDKPGEIKGKVTGKPLGKGTYAGKVDFPNATYVMKFKGGTITFTEAGKLDGSIAKGKWKIKKGTGKFKGIKGGGTSAGDITKQADGFKYKGTVKY